MLITYYLIAGAVIAGWYGLYFLWKRRTEADVAEGAAVEYARYQRAEPHLVEGMDEGRFRSLYARTEVPAQPLYTWAAMAIFLLGAPFILALTSTVITWMEVTGVIPQPAEAAQQLQVSAEGFRPVARADLEALQLILQGWGGFFSFFALLIFWVLVFFAVMRRYHRTRPGSLREEVLRSR
ncbi:hypothetical protein [Parvularcula maris]|uniref:Uncharacterized protein n=1 Tax=Parvularcula maris TaxID=2965077 RepID=A0A9X2LB86_9PROT|nr:hypothetical protein [Parvularcula maris]MCQ8186298.1 hypothetical protein [Parvularcula maris]